MLPSKDFLELIRDCSLFTERLASMRNSSNKIKVVQDDF